MKRGSSRYARLRFGKDMLLEVTLPWGSKASPKKLLGTKREWIKRTLLKLTSSTQVFDRKQLLFKGAPYRLMVNRAKRHSVRIKGRTVFLKLAEGEDVNQSIKSWMTQQTEKYATSVIRKFRRKLGFSIRGIGVTDARKWGHCTRDRRLVFNWQLAALSNGLAEYVILHELYHLSEFNHGNRFRAELFSLCPDFKEREEELRSIVPMQA